MKGLRAVLIAGSVCLTLLAAADAFHAFAEEQESGGGKFRIGFHLGGTRTQANVDSAAGNTLFLEDPFREPVDFIRDPRNDTGALNSLNIGYGSRATLSGDYQFNDRWSVSLSAGYQRADVGEVELQLQPFGIPLDQQFVFLFDVYGVDTGTIEQVPLDFTIAARFRPKAAVRPFVGFGFGYMFVGFDPSDEMDQLSRRMDASAGADTRLSGPAFGRKFMEAVAGTERSFSGANIEAPDSWTWHGVAGLEWAFRRNWAFVTDIRYVGANKNFSIKFDGQDSLGREVPRGIRTLPTNAFPGSYPYGAVAISEGGLLDTGGLYIREADNNGQIVYTPCEIGTAGCAFYKIPDGELDLGLYYVQGGELRYSYLGVQLGVRYTF